MNSSPAQSNVFAEEGEKYSVVEGIDLAKFSPMPKHLVIRWLKKVESKGGILYPENRQRKNFFKGEILKVGPDCDKRLKEGVVIQFDSMCDKQFLGPQDPHDRDTVFMMVEDDVHGIIVDDASFMHFFPLNDYVLIQPEEGVEQSGGLVIPKSAGKQIRTQGWAGKVIDMGPDVECLDGNESPRVIYDRHSANEIILNDKKHVIVRGAYIDMVIGDDVNVHLMGAI